MKRLFVLSLVSCLLTGCGIYGKYSRPDMEIEAQYRYAENTADTATLVSLSWREFFTDTCLQSLIEQGLRQNTDLRFDHIQGFINLYHALGGGV